MKTNTKKQTKTERQSNLRRGQLAAPDAGLDNQPKAKRGKAKESAQVVQLPAPETKEALVVGRSVVHAVYKAKATKSGVWKDDRIHVAIRNAFLEESSSTVLPAQAARIATDRILSDNGLDVGRWEGKNPGMLSMNLSNVLRGLLRNDGQVIVYGKTINA